LLYYSNMNDKTYTLELNDEQVATISDVSYETPMFSGRYVFSDNALRDKMLNAYDLMQWEAKVSEDDDLSDEDYDKKFEEEMTNLELTEEDYNTYKNGKWAVKVNDGTSMRLWAPALDKDGVITWRQYN
jgi:hypothetical protein